MLDPAELGVVEVEEPVAIADRGELLAPDRQLELSELGPVEVTLGDHPGEGVDLVDVPVNRLETGGEGGAADAGDSVLAGFIAAESDDVAVTVEELDEVQNVGVVDRV